MSFRALWVVTTLGYATHGLLDACTTYGTQLFWPFSDLRVAWNNVGIVDPFYTLPLLLFVGIAAWKRRVRIARVGVGFAIAYLLLGVVQRERAQAAADQLASTRGHVPSSTTVKPTIGNLVLWRSIYFAEGRWWIDAVRVGLGESGTKVYEGGSLAPAVLPHAPPGSALEEDLRRFAWFSGHALARHPDEPDVVGDLRYSMLPNGLRPLWGLRLGVVPPDRHAPFVTFQRVGEGDLGKFVDMVLGR
jgi:inner membrane protein